MSSTSAAQEAREFEPREFVAQGDKQVDRRVLWLNLLLLCAWCLSLPTSLLGTGYRNPLVVRLYGSTLVATNAAGLLFWLYAKAHRYLVVPHLNRDFAKWVARIHSSPILVYAVVIGIG